MEAQRRDCVHPDNARLRIGVNALYLIPGGVGGTEIYLRNLLRALAAIDHCNEYFVFTNYETDRSLVPAAANFLEVPQAVRARNRPARLLWEQTLLPLQVARKRLDCLLNPGFTAPVVASCPNVTVFHDLQHKRHPEHFRWFDRPAWNLFLWAAVHRSRLLLAVSDVTRDDLIRYYNIAPERIRVALHGVEDEFYSIAELRASEPAADLRSTGPPYLLCASTLHPHKNIERLVRAFARFREQRPGFELVLAGMRGFQASAIEAQIVKLKLEPYVRVTGWVPRTELYELFHHAAAFVYPSMFEGFGMPVVEAMAAGVPLACSDIEPLRSITGSAAIRFDPDSEENMLAAMLRVSQDSSLVAAAHELARQFTWQHCASKTLEAIRDAANSKGHRPLPAAPK